jgi:hypothetical protein
MVSGTKITALSEMPANSGNPSMTKHLMPWVPKYLTSIIYLTTGVPVSFRLRNI